MNRLSALTFAALAVAGATTVRLTEDNVLTFRGPVTGVAASNFINKLMSKRNNTELFVYLATPGGSVTAGLEIAQTIGALHDLGVNVTCVSDVALSMGFVLTQMCPNRVVMPSSILMQHQIAFGLEGPMHNVRSYLGSIVDWDNDMDQIQADRLGMTLQQFQDKVHDDWWLFGRRAVAAGAADVLANVYCDFEPGVEKFTINTLFGPINLVYSTCPVARDPLSISFGREDDKTVCPSPSPSPNNSTSTPSDKELLNLVRQYFYWDAATKFMGRTL